MKIKRINSKVQFRVFQQVSNKVIGNSNQLSVRNTYKNNN